MKKCVKVSLVFILCAILLIAMGCSKNSDKKEDINIATVYETISKKAETDPRYMWIKAFIDADADTCSDLVNTLPEETYDERCRLYKTWYGNFKTITIGDYSVSEADGYVDFKFEVTSSKHDVFTEGTYHYKVTDGVVSAVHWERVDSEKPNETLAYSLSLVNIISPFCSELKADSDLTDISDEAVFHVVFFSNSDIREDGGIDAEFLHNGAEIMFGVSDFSPSSATAVLENGRYSLAGKGGFNVAKEIINAEKSNDMITLDVQFYADPMKTVKSLLIRFTLAENDTEYKYTFENIEVLSEGLYSPFVWMS